MMTITAAHLTRAAALSAVAAGAIFLAVQINHPPMEVASVETTEWVVRSTAKAAMSILALAGITGMYLRQIRRIGLLGLIGYVVFALGYLVMLCVEATAAAVLPTVALADPGYVDDILLAAAGGAPAGDIGGMQAVLGLSGIAYLAGGLLFGVALFRARILSRSMSALLALGALGTAALALLPEEFNRPMAVPLGVALIGLGVSLWRHHRDVVAPAAEPHVPARVMS